MRILALVLLTCFSLCCVAQYAPQAGIAGSTAIPAGSASFVGWATQCTTQRGWQNIAVKDSGYVSAGDTSLALGIADGNIISLGDSGVATLQFTAPLFDGPGPDFAVFENGFKNPANPEEAFLELAFVEVSSDGQNFFRFPAQSLTQDTEQLSSIAGENYMNARLLNNLAGKYVSGYGTPFDLSDLTGIAGLDVSHITHVRLVDVIGDIGVNKSHDSAGRVINDPYPTLFPTGGFDLDAVGAIHMIGAGTGAVLLNAELSLYPNPAALFLYLKFQKPIPAGISVEATDVFGRTVLTQKLNTANDAINVQLLSPGAYFLHLQTPQGPCVLPFVRQ